MPPMSAKGLGVQTCLYMKVTVVVLFDICHPHRFDISHWKKNFKKNHHIFEKEMVDESDN